MDHKYLITGATGFVGACLTHFLVNKRKNVSVLVRDKKLNWRLKDIKSKLQIYECDLLSSSLPKVINRIKPDIIFHLATYGTLPNEGDVDRMIEVNIKGTLNLLNAVKLNKFKLFINTGSSSEYGIKNKPMNEEDVTLPINDYGVTKAAASMLCSKVALRENLPIITFRLFSPFGYFEEKMRLIPQVLLNAMNNKKIELSSPTNVRDFIFIEDVIDAYIKATKVKTLPGEIFNIGSGKQHTVEEVVKMVLQITRSNSKIAWGEIKKQARQIEPKIWQADIKKANKILKWQPENNLYMGLEKTIEWFKEKNFMRQSL